MSSPPPPSNPNHHFWWQSPWLLILRLPLAGLNWLITEIRNLLYDWHWLPVKRVPAVVVSVGNLSAGGSGKTLLVETLVEKLVDAEFSVGIVSRGYGRSTKGIQIVADDTQLLLTPGEAGDEPYLLALNLPHIPIMVGEDKAETCQRMIDLFDVQVILLDDGFQHRHLHRDLDCVILNHTCKRLGNILPLGELREARHQLRRSDLHFYAKLPDSEIRQVVQHDILNLVYSDTLVNSHKNHFPLKDISGPVGAFCGIGKPRYFFNELHRLGVIPELELIFPDHCAYDIAHQARLNAAGMDLWITTQKDWVKFPPEYVARHHIYYLPVQVALHPDKWAEILTRVQVARTELDGKVA